MCCGSSVSANDTTEFLSFPSSRTCLWGGGCKFVKRGKATKCRRWINEGRQSRQHSPNTKQSIVCRPGQKIETVAVGRSCGGEAQGRHSCRVTCEFLQWGGWHCGANMRQTTAPCQTWFLHIRSHCLRCANSPYRPPWCLNPTSWLSDRPTAAVFHRGSHRDWLQARGLPSIYCGENRHIMGDDLTFT